MKSHQEIKKRYMYSKPGEGSTAVQTRLPKVYFKKLKKLAAEEGVSVCRMARILLEEAIK